MKLYEYTQDYLQLLELADEIDSEMFQDTLHAIKESIEDKAQNIAKLIRSFEADVLGLKTEEERLAKKRKALEAKILYLKGYLHEQLDLVGMSKIKTPLFTVSIQANPPGVNVLDESEIPSEYWIPTAPKLDKKSILEKLKAGGIISGCEIKQTKGLRIR